LTISAVKEVKGVVLTPELEATRLEELEIDSLDLIEVGMIIEAEFGVQLDPQDFDGLETVSDLMETLEKKVESSRG
jgi:acyl carrier protein